MQSQSKLGGRRSATGPVAAIVVGATAWALSVTPILAQPATGETLANAVVAACTGLSWAEAQAAFGGDVPKVTACRETAYNSFQAAMALAAADQEQLGLAFTELLREPVEAAAPATFPAVTYLLTTQYEGWIATYCTPAAAAPWGLGTLEACTGTIRMVLVGSQALAAELVSMTANSICSGILNSPAEWRTASFAILDELAARAATGTDPVMQVRIDETVTGIAACR